MRADRVILTVSIALLGLVGPFASPARAAGIERTLDNGLRVHLIDAPGGRTAAVLVLFDVGSDHDPPGRCGLAHLVEHLYVTAAAGEVTPARDIDGYLAAYPEGWNAQTATDCTVIASIVPADGLDDELIDAAARLGDLRIEQADLDREVPRVIDEVERMFGAGPMLAAINHGRELVRPTPHGGRRGGLPGEVAALTLEDVRAFARRYRPASARLVVVAPKATNRFERIETLFGSIESGPPAGPPAASAGPRAAGDDRETVHRASAPLAPAGAPSIAAVAIAPPAPGTPGTVATLVALARLMERTGPGPRATVLWPILDGPEAALVATEVPAGRDAEAAAGKLAAAVDEAFSAPVTATDRRRVRRTWGAMLGLGARGPAAAVLAARNPYFVAFTTARRAQLGLDGEALAAELAALGTDDLHRLRDRLRAEGRIARLIVEAPPASE